MDAKSVRKFDWIYDPDLDLHSFPDKQNNNNKKRTKKWQIHGALKKIQYDVIFGIKL